MKALSALLRAGLLASTTLVLLLPDPAHAAPITVSNAGYWLETVGTNTIGIAAGGTPAGTVTSLFVANTDPLAGTTATASLPSGATTAPVVDPTGLWARRALNPNAAQLAPLTVVFSNGPDQASFTGRDLTGLVAMPLVAGLSVNAAGNPLRPIVSWNLPAGAGDVDFIQIVFYNDDTNLEIGNRVTRPGDTTSFQFASDLPLNFNFVINVRLIDLAVDGDPFVSGNIQRQSRAYINYTSPVPEPTTALLLAGGLAGLGWLQLQRRANRNGRPLWGKAACPGPLDKP